MLVAVTATWAVAPPRGGRGLKSALLTEEKLLVKVAPPRGGRGLKYAGTLYRLWP